LEEQIAINNQRQRIADDVQQREEKNDTTMSPA